LKYAKVKEAYQKINLHCPESHDRKKLSPPEIKKHDKERSLIEPQKRLNM
jgi:hypothetical protein